MGKTDGYFRYDYVEGNLSEYEYEDSMTVEEYHEKLSKLPLSGFDGVLTIFEDSDSEDVTDSFLVKETKVPDTIIKYLCNRLEYGWKQCTKDVLDEFKDNCEYDGRVPSLFDGVEITVDGTRQGTVKVESTFCPTMRGVGCTLQSVNIDDNAFFNGKNDSMRSLYNVANNLIDKFGVNTGTDIERVFFSYYCNVGVPHNFSTFSKLKSALPFKAYESVRDNEDGTIDVGFIVIDTLSEDMIKKLSRYHF